MAQQDDSPANEQTTEAAPKKGGWRRWINKKTVGGFIAVSVIVHGVGFLYFGIVSPNERSTANGEVSLGEFEFLAPEGHREGVLQAGFTLQR